MKPAPRTPGVLIDDSRHCPAGDALPTESALALAAAAGARQRMLDLPPMTDADLAATSAEEVIQLLDGLRPGYRSTWVQRGPRTFLVVTDR